MWFLSSFDSLNTPSSRTLRRRNQRRPAGRPLRLEALETRMVMSHTVIADAGDLPAGPLEGPAAQPNFVFILTDDQDTETLKYMPRLQELLADQGTTFANAFVTNPLCCPSNVSILTGQYSHNNQILHNVPPQGGFQKFVDMRTDGDPATLGDETTLATWLQDAGYFTGRIGKYLVGYPVDSTYVPPGWDEWQSSYGGFTSYFNYALNENGTVVEYGANDEDYITDVLTRKAVQFIEDAEATDDQPFFLQFVPTAPHAGTTPNGPPTPAPRHLGMFDGEQAPRTPSFNEADVSDKPPHIANLPSLTAGQIAAIDRQYQARLESLQSVDEGIAQIIDALAARGELENTYIIFASDNGYHLGQHRMFQGKGEAYEEDIRVPLVVRGPGVQAGVTLEHMALNIDFAPTIAELAGATAGREMDGRSLASLLVRDMPLNEWRHDFLVEIYRNPPMQPGSPGLALRTRHELYVEYADGFRELYDLGADPYQLDNLYGGADPARLDALSGRLHELAACAGDDCRANPPAAQVASVVINDGSAQRSMVNSVTVTFDQLVTLDAGALELQQQDGSLVGLSIATSALNGQTIAVLTFSGTGIVGGSLADGDYVLTIRGDRIQNLLRQELDGDADGIAGGNRTEAFFRLFGDSDGDSDVDRLDLDAMLTSFLKRRGDAGFLWYFDHDGDDDVDGLDMSQFNQRRQS